MNLNKIIAAEITDTERSALRAARQSNIAYEVSNHPVLDADGTLIFTYGPLTFELKKIWENSNLPKKPCLHLDLEETPVHRAPQVINQWIRSNKIQVLYVSGPNQGDSPDIIESTRLVISRLIFFNSESESNFTESIVEEILGALSFEDKITIANMDAVDLDRLQSILNRYPIGLEPRIRDGKHILARIWSRLYGTHRKITVVAHAM